MQWAIASRHQKPRRSPQSIRHPKTKQLLWADAICINQKDITEKGQYVKRMGNVFAGARRVLAWLGKDTKGMAQDCFALIRETVKYLDQLYEKHRGSLLDMAQPPASCPISGNQARWDQVRELGDLTWFSRAWIVQGAGLAKDCILVWGKERLEIAELIALAVYNHALLISIDSQAIWASITS